MEPIPTKSAPVKAAPKPAPTKSVESAAKEAPEVKEVKEVKVAAGNLDVTALRRMWPDVIESVKKKRRLTWSLLSASAQILSVDENHITIGIVNAGARDSFIRSESEPILSDAFVEVTGMRRKIEVVVDPSVNPYSPANMGKRTDEDLSDTNQLAGTELIMKELGARVIAESEK
jgi:DNA polymerase-3 subunit gamma/tau